MESMIDRHTSRSATDPTHPRPGVTPTREPYTQMSEGAVEFSADDARIVSDRRGLLQSIPVHKYELLSRPLVSHAQHLTVPGQCQLLQVQNLKHAPETAEDKR